MIEERYIELWDGRSERMSTIIHVNKLDSITFIEESNLVFDEEIYPESYKVIFNFSFSNVLFYYPCLVEPVNTVKGNIIYFYKLFIQGQYDFLDSSRVWEWWGYLEPDQKDS